MKTSPCRAGLLSAVFVGFTALLHAHPGHDGHDLTWDFGHLAQHPFATIAWVAVAGAIGGAAMMLVRRPAARRAQSFRGSQPSRGK